MAALMAFHTDHFKVNYNKFFSANMADIWLAKQAWEQDVKIICLDHEAGYIKYQYPQNTIWDKEKSEGFKRQTAILKQFLK